ISASPRPPGRPGPGCGRSCSFPRTAATAARHRPGCNSAWAHRLGFVCPVGLCGAERPVHKRTSRGRSGVDASGAGTSEAGPGDEGFSMSEPVAVFLFGLVLLTAGAELLSRGLAWVERAFGDNQPVERVFVAAVVYSTPVLAVCLAAALSGFPKTALAT